MSKDISFWLKYSELYCSKKPQECLGELLQNGYLVPLALLKTCSKQLKKRRRITLQKIWDKRTQEVHLWAVTEDGLPYKDLFVLDLSKRRKTLQYVKERLIRTICYFVNPDEIYMYNPDGKSAYKWYSGQKLIIYEITKEMNRNVRLKIWNDILKTKIGFYDLTDPLHFTKKVILCDVNDIDMYRFLRYDLGDDDSHLKERFMAAWNNTPFVDTPKDTDRNSSPLALNEISTPDEATYLNLQPKVFKCVKKRNDDKTCRIGQLKAQDKKPRKSSSTSSSRGRSRNVSKFSPKSRKKLSKFSGKGAKKSQNLCYSISANWL